MAEGDYGPPIGQADTRFASHFTHPRYYPERPDFGDERPPFGSDEGWDAVHTWSERADEVRAHPSLRYMLSDNLGGENPNDLVDELKSGDQQPDMDDVIIGLGFALLRLTGQIDPEGRVWIEDAITRQRDRSRSPDPEYADLLDDLRTFG